MGLETMICSNCGSQLPADAAYCGKCGARIPQDVPVQAGAPDRSIYPAAPPVPPYGLPQKKKYKKGSMIAIAVAGCVIGIALIMGIMVIALMDTGEDYDLVGQQEEIVVEKTKPKKYKRGVVSGTSYKNRYFDLEFTIPDDNYVIADAEEIYRGSGKGDIEEETPVLEMGCTRKSDASMVYVMTQKLPEGTTTNEMVKLIEKEVEEGLNNSDYTVVSEDRMQIIAGKIYHSITLKYSGMDVTVKAYYTRKENRMLGIMLGYKGTEESKEKELLSMFHKINE